MEPSTETTMETPVMTNSNNSDRSVTHDRPDASNCDVVLRYTKCIY